MSLEDYDWSTSFTCCTQWSDVRCSVKLVNGTHQSRLAVMFFDCILMSPTFKTGFVDGSQAALRPSYLTQNVTSSLPWPRVFGKVLELPAGLSGETLHLWEIWKLNGSVSRPAWPATPIRPVVTSHSPRS